MLLHLGIKAESLLNENNLIWESNSTYRSVCLSVTQLSECVTSSATTPKLGWGGVLGNQKSPKFQRVSKTEKWCLIFILWGPIKHKILSIVLKIANYTIISLIFDWFYNMYIINICKYIVMIAGSNHRKVYFFFQWQGINCFTVAYSQATPSSSKLSPSLGRVDPKMKIIEKYIWTLKNKSS